MKGCYCLIINMNKSCEIEIGKLGKISFKRGCHVYVGSAMNSLAARISRHLSDDKKLHWHIDYLLKNENAEISEVIYNVSEEKIECRLSQIISDKSNGIEGFGCSDCDCESHLYYFKNRKEAIECVKGAYDSIAMECKSFNK
ncbi:GIY-YIG nuclease family protein [Methanobrevibacter sp.]|uniref:GIY-YIG nuclease family protein n=1 Tax=Methanobrevibacter sp. TaxID=66852 RepID=UPI00388EDDBA